MKKIFNLKAQVYPYFLFYGAHCYLNLNFKNSIRKGIQEKNMTDKLYFVILNMHEKKD